MGIRQEFPVQVLTSREGSETCSCSHTDGNVLSCITVESGGIVNSHWISRDGSGAKHATNIPGVYTLHGPRNPSGSLEFIPLID